ncbi:MAG: DNA recombination protein RmuC [Rhodospirillales bacterium]|nr:DNA recombination protein RmuC [Rhodospirillales bacterium]
MDISAVLGTLLAVAVALLAFVFARLRAAPERLEAERIAAEAMREELRRDLEIERARAAAAQEAATAAHGDKREAEARLAKAEETIAALVAERDRAVEAREAAERERAEALRREAIAAEALRGIEAQLRDFEKIKADFLNITQATTLDVAQKLSSQLIENHKRESEAAKAEAEARVKQSTEQLTARVEQLTSVLNQLQGRVEADSKALNTMLRALASPTGAGQHAEIWLANTLRGFDLEEGRDYVLQFSTQDADSGARLRPDAIVFLPHDTIFVIDSKASKHFLAIGEAEDAEAEKAAYQRLAQTMRGHLRALASKDYSGAVREECRRLGRGAARLQTFMCLPNDAALEKLRHADPELRELAIKLDIVLAGPAVISCALHIARSQITAARQLENQQAIADAAKALLDGLSIVLGHALAVGKGIKSAADHYAKFSSSMNRTLLGRARRLEAYGIRPGKPLPPPLPAYHVNMAESLIEGEAEEVVEDRPLPRLVSGES